MGPARLTAALFLLMYLATAHTPFPAGAQDKPKFALTEDEQKLLDLTNEERKKAGLGLLKPNPVLFQVARAHAANMAKQGKMEHNLDGKTPFERMKAAGYKYAWAAENIAVGDVAPEAVMKGWMDSMLHHDNILKAEFTEIGLGLARDDKNQTYYTQVFGKPRP